MKGKFSYLNLLIILFTIGCSSSDYEIREGEPVDIEMITTHGTIIMRLSDETPIHRDNFIKNVRAKFYDSLLFHRIIENFVVQTGDPNTRPESLLTDSVYLANLFTISAEFSPNLFHKRGALNAARWGDDENPFRESSSSQFTIIQGRVYNDSTLDIAAGRINNWLAYNAVINDTLNRDLHELYLDLFKRGNDEDSIAMVYGALQTKVEIELAITDPYTYPEAHKQIYKTEGGAAHLDQNYTVFGHVVKGMDVVDKIATVPTNDRDFPKYGVRVITARLIKRKDYDESSD